MIAAGTWHEHGSHERARDAAVELRQRRRLPHDRSGGDHLVTIGFIEGYRLQSCSERSCRYPRRCGFIKGQSTYALSDAVGIMRYRHEDHPHATRPH